MNNLKLLTIVAITLSFLTGCELPQDKISKPLKESNITSHRFSQRMDCRDRGAVLCYDFIGLDKDGKEVAGIIDCDEYINCKIKETHAVVKKTKPESRVPKGDDDFWIFLLPPNSAL